MKYLISLCLAAAFAAPVYAQQEAFTAKIFKVDGVVEHQKAGTSAWGIVQAPDTIEAGDTVRTGPASMAEIYVKYGSKVRLGAGTTFVLKEASKDSTAMEVLVGKMQGWFRKALARKLSVRTPSAVCAIRGTSFEVEVNQAGETTWNLFTGNVQVTDNQNNVRDLAPHQRLTVTSSGAGQPEPLPAEIKAPSEPKKIKEEKDEIKAEEKAAKEEAKAAAEAKKEEPAKEEAKGEEPVVEEPVVLPLAPESSVNPTQEVQESNELSPSNP